MTQPSTPPRALSECRSSGKYACKQSEGMHKCVCGQVGGSRGGGCNALTVCLSDMSAAGCAKLSLTTLWLWSDSSTAVVSSEVIDHSRSVVSTDTTQQLAYPKKEIFPPLRGHSRPDRSSVSVGMPLHCRGLPAETDDWSGLSGRGRIA